MGVAELGSTATLSLLCNTPAVLTIRRRCAEEGCTLVCKPAQDPYMIIPGGIVVVLEQSGYIPYLNAHATLGVVSAWWLPLRRMSRAMLWMLRVSTW